MTDHDDQTPTRADFRRAAALYLHRRHHDHAGVTTILADAGNRQRCSALVLAAIDLAFQSPYALRQPSRHRRPAARSCTHGPSRRRRASPQVGVPFAA